MVDGKKILIVDDETHITHLLAYKMEREGFHALTANDGQTGFELACKNRPCLILADFQMPILSGYDMAVKLKDDNRTAQIPVLMLTARGHKLSPQELACTNIQYLVAKPFSARQLIDKARQAVHNTLQQFPPDEAEGKAA